MATDVASADAEKKPDTDTKPKAVEEKHDGTGAASTAPTVQRAAGTSLGQRQVQAKSAHGNARIGDADDSAERKADMAADHVMRMPDTSPAPPATPGSSPASGSTPAPTPAAGPSPASAGPSPASAGPSPASAGRSTATPEEPVRRTEDPTAEQRLPGAETAKPATPGTGAAPGTGPDTMTPAGPAPLIAPPATAGARPAETGTPAPDAEPPAPEGEAPARETPQVPNDVQEYLDASRGMGAPLPDATLKFFEDKFRRPFDDVRIHDDGGADDAAKKIDALAFTRGNDIYFRSGAYDPTTAQGKGVLAHELAHVVQQRPGINRKTAPGLGGTVIRRAPEKENGPTGGGKKKQASRGGNEVNLEDKETGQKGHLKLANVRIPAFKVKFHPDAEFIWNKKERADKGVETPRLGTYEKVWRDAVSARLKDAVQKRAGQATPPYRYQFGRTKKEQRFYIGNADDIAYSLSVLPWDKEQEPAEFQIDHKKELQLGGVEDHIDNLWLYEKGVNMSSGTTINNAITNDIKNFLEQVRPELERVPDINEVRVWAVEGNVKFGPAVADGKSGGKAASEGADVPKHYWTRGEIEVIESLKPLEELSDENRDRAVGTEEKIVLYSRRGGGKPRPPVKRNKDNNTIARIFGPGFSTEEGGTYSKKSAAEPGAGLVTLKLFESDKEGKGIPDDKKPINPVNLTFPIDPMPGVDWGGVLDTSALAKLARQLQSSKASPISLSSFDFDLDDGLQARGEIPRPSIPLLENVQIGVFVSGADIGLKALINGGDLKLPGPFKVSGGALILTASVVEGLKVEGIVYFGIQSVATGFIKAKAGTSTDFALDAELQFDKKMFDGDAKVKGSYEDGKWAVEGTLGVGPGKIKGIKKASATVKVTEDTVTADGEFETSLKGVDKGKLGFRYNEATGMEITGEIILGQGIPGVKSGKLDATIKEGPTGHSLSGGVTLEPSVPGLTGTVTGRYEDGAFLVEADLGYEKGLAKGKVNVGLTNQEVDEHGKPSGPPKPDGSVTAFGIGLVTLTLTPWLKGTVGLKLTPKGEIEVSGEVALPSEFEVFGKLPLEKEVFSVHIDVPIIGLSVAGVHVGIFATVGGGATVSAGVGPGVLRDVALKVTYNPDKPDDTTVTGTGSFAIPAHASLRLTVDGGVGAGIPLVDAEAKLSAYGEVGVAGEVSAGVQVDWAPRTGIVLDARGDIFVEPRFRFGVDASVEVTVGVWRLTKTLYEHTWHLANFEYGSSLRFGLSLPIHYESLKPFDIAFEQIQWTYPQIEPKDLLSGLMKQLVG